MPITSEDIELFKIVYAQNADKPMEFIQEEVLKAKMALLANSEVLAAKAESEKNAAADKKPHFVELKKSDLILKTRNEIDNAIAEDSITCCICGRKMNSLGAHLKRVHHVDPKEYIRICGYPEGTNLMSKKSLVKARANVKKALSMRNKKEEIAQ